MTDVSAERYWTVVSEFEVPSLQSFEAMMSGQGQTPEVRRSSNIMKATRSGGRRAREITNSRSWRRRFRRGRFRIGFLHRAGRHEGPGPARCASQPRRAR
jgi:hypothetical protein